MDETKVVLGLSKDEDEDLIKERKRDLNKITKYLIRQTHAKENLNQSESWNNLKDMNFWEFLYAVGMFNGQKMLDEYNEIEMQETKTRYINAISASVKGTAMVVVKRKVKDIFVNGFNPKVMRLHKTNQDLQLCIDQYAFAQYICGYLKN